MMPVRKSQNWLPNIFNDFFGNEWLARPNSTVPAVNIIETDDEFKVEVAAPGLTKDDFQINISEDNELVITMEHRSESSQGDDTPSMQPNGNGRQSDGMQQESGQQTQQMQQASQQDGQTRQESSQQGGNEQHGHAQQTHGSSMQHSQSQQQENNTQHGGHQPNGQSQQAGESMQHTQPQQGGNRMQTNNRSEKKGTYLRREFSYTQFQQSMILPDNIDKDGITASVTNGVLTIDIPKKKADEKEKGDRQIQIQ